jgi:hypothetical protein
MLHIERELGCNLKKDPGKRFPIQKMWEPFSMGTFILIPIVLLIWYKNQVNEKRTKNQN